MVTVGGVSAVSVTFLVSLGWVVVVAAVVMLRNSDFVVVVLIKYTSALFTTVEATVLPASVGDVEASATTVFGVVMAVDVVGFTVGTLFSGLGGVVLAGPGVESLLGGI